MSDQQWQVLYQFMAGMQSSLEEITRLLAEIERRGSDAAPAEAGERRGRDG